MEDSNNSSNLDNIQNQDKVSNLNIEEWKDYKQFLKLHELQLYAMGFPLEELGEKLYYKLKYEIFEDNIFSLNENEDDNSILISSKINMEKNKEIFLIDHFFTFKIREFENHLKDNPQIVDRLFKMLKYASQNKSIQTLENEEIKEIQDLNGKIKELKNTEISLKKNKALSNIFTHNLFYQNDNIHLLNEEEIYNNSDKIKKLVILNYDNLDIDDNHLEKIYLNKEISIAISLENNKLENINALVKFLLTHPTIKIIWINNNKYPEDLDVYEILSQLKSIEMINDKFTEHVSEKTAQYLDDSLFHMFYFKNMNSNDDMSYYLNKTGNNKPNYVDFSFRKVLKLKNENLKNFLKFFKHSNSVQTICLTENIDDDYFFNNYRSIFENLNLILSTFTNVNKIELDLEESELFNSEELRVNNILRLILENQSYDSIKKIKYVNDILIDDFFKIFNNIALMPFINSNEDDKNFEEIFNKNEELIIENSAKFHEILKKEYIRKYMWKIIGTYRLITENQYDENSTFYINDEFGSALMLNHSDSPNVKMFPFIFSKSNDFKNDSITYSILWPIKNITKNSYLSRDNLDNITENDQRSSKLTMWYKTPEEYFLSKFQEKIYNLNQNELKHKNILNTLDNDLKTLKIKIKSDFEKSQEKFNYKLYIDEYQKHFNFTLLEDFISKKKLGSFREKIYQNTYKSITSSLLDYDLDLKRLINSNLKKKLENNEISKVKVFSDLEYVRTTLSDPFEITSEINEADIVWLNVNYYSLKPLYTSLIEKHEKSDDNIAFKDFHFKNQIPFEAILTMKVHLMNLIQETNGISSYYNISYDLNSELAEIIGNYLYNKDAFLSKNERLYYKSLKLDNSWILKPINMTRSMDMIVTNNIFEIIKNADTGTKICQKYIDNPYLVNEKKFDIRYMVLIKSLAPLEVYIYKKVFWFRTSNKNFTLNTESFTDYETHFTVMNYDKKVSLNQIFDYQFIEYLEKNNVSYETIYNKIRTSLKEIITFACYKCPQMIEGYSKAIYAVDIMIDSDLNPKILEFNFSPDCARATKYTSTFYQDIFNTLFLDNPTNVELI